MEDSRGTTGSFPYGILCRSPSDRGQPHMRQLTFSGPDDIGLKGGRFKKNHPVKSASPVGAWELWGLLSGGEIIHPIIQKKEVITTFSRNRTFKIKAISRKITPFRRFID